MLPRSGQLKSNYCQGLKFLLECKIQKQLKSAEMKPLKFLIKFQLCMQLKCQQAVKVLELLDAMKELHLKFRERKSVEMLDELQKVKAIKNSVKLKHQR